ncbi:MAG TPA: spermidine/putrescine ABC transporter ATP-binding protein, partial [Firmicutes bacterium]|nr:spermidine/putrescine ABC transporter ATP-binding protein [Bacillota bacterium]
MGNDIIIQLNNLSKQFDGTTVVDNLSLSIKKGEFVTFLGPSGCGKTTTLRMIAGFEIPNQGTILLNGADITKLPPYQRPVNTVFQRYALFPHLDVYDNIAFGLRLKKVDVKTTLENGKVVIEHRKYNADEIDDKVLNALKIVDLEDF